MKILHTSDWHLGHTLYEHDRTAEHAAFLSQLRDIVEEEKPDALLVCGDIYDRTNPSTSVQRMYYKALLDMHEACPEMAIIVTAGNHDSKAMLELGRELWLMAGVRVIGQVERRDGVIDLDRHIIGIDDADGVRKGYVVAVPHIFDQNYPAFEGDTTKGDRRNSFFRALQERVKEVNAEGLPLVMMAHLTVADCNCEGHDPEMIGGINEVPQEELGSVYDYIALGHIHYPQTMKGLHGVARYSGSPVPVNFDETYPHSVSVVTLEHGSAPDIRVIRIHNVKPMLTVPAVPSGFEEALAELENIADDEVCYVRLNIMMDKPMPSDYMERIAQALNGKMAEYCYCKITRPEMDEVADDTAVTYDEFRELSPIDVAQRFYKSKFGTEMPQQMADMIVEAVRRYDEDIDKNF